MEKCILFIFFNIFLDVISECDSFSSFMCVVLIFQLFEHDNYISSRNKIFFSFVTTNRFIFFFFFYERKVSHWSRSVWKELFELESHENSITLL